MDYNAPSFWIVAAVLIMSLPVIHYRSSSRTLQRTVDRQNDTIHRLLNREPVTYQETGQKPTKIIEEVYSAWGNVTVDREVEDRG